jgi:hypothetical protein
VGKSYVCLVLKMLHSGEGRGHARSSCVICSAADSKQPVK